MPQCQNVKLSNCAQAVVLQLTALSSTVQIRTLVANYSPLLAPEVVRAVTSEHLVFRVVQRRQVESWERNLLHEFCLIIRIGFVTIIIACQLALAPRAQRLQRRRLRIYAPKASRQLCRKL